MGHIPLPWPSTSDVDALVEMSGGSFRRASEFIKIVAETDMPHLQLAIILDVTPDIPPHTPESVAPNEFPASIGTTALEGLIEKLILPCASILRLCYLSC
jgi:hypothetical protein